MRDVKALWKWKMAIRKLITILIRPVLLLVALGINNRQGHVAGL